MLFLKSQKDFPPLFESAGCVCFCKGTILLLKRTELKSYPGYWGIPSGKVNEKETHIHAAIRELFEETGILVSSEKLAFVGTFHVVNTDMSFLYSLFVCQLDAFPQVKIRNEEHIRHAWFKLPDALRLQLIPDLDGCLRSAVAYLEGKQFQPSLFPFLIKKESPSISSLEKAIEISPPKEGFWAAPKIGKPWYVSFGAPAVGKTSGLKAMAEKNETSKFVEDRTILRRSSRLNYYLRKAFEEDERSFFFNFQVEILPLRFWQAVAAPAYSLVDESIYSNLAYSRALYNLGWIKNYEYQAFYSIYDVFLKMLPDPTKLFHFNCEPRTIMKRINQRGRAIEKAYSSQYIEALWFSFFEVSKELSKDINVIVIDTDKLQVDDIAELYGPSKTETT